MPVYDKSAPTRLRGVARGPAGWPAPDHATHAALEAARLATAAKIAAQRSILEAEASRDRSDRALRAALAANRDLQAKLDGLARGFGAAKAEPDAERQARLKADNSRREALMVTSPEFLPPASRDDASVQTVRRPVVRPRETVLTAGCAGVEQNRRKSRGF
jgi:hypothetical protein